MSPNHLDEVTAVPLSEALTVYSIQVRRDLSCLTDDANRRNENLCYFDSLVQFVIELSTSFCYLKTRRIESFFSAGEISLKSNGFKPRHGLVAVCSFYF